MLGNGISSEPPSDDGSSVPVESSAGGSTMSAVFLLVGVMLAAALVFGGFQTQSAASSNRVAGGGRAWCCSRRSRWRRSAMSAKTLWVWLRKTSGSRRCRRGRSSPPRARRVRKRRSCRPVGIRGIWPFIYDIDVVRADHDPGRPDRPAQRRGRTAAASGHDVCPRVEPRDQGPHGPGRRILSHRRRRLQGAAVVGARAGQISDQSRSCSRSRSCRPRRSIAPWSAS